MIDKCEVIVHKMYEALLSEASQEGSIIYGFHVYDKIPRRDPLFFPCIVLLRGTEQTVEEYFGGGSMTSFDVTVQLAVKEKSSVEDDTDIYEDEAMLLRYRDFMDEFFDDLFTNTSIPEINLGLSGNSFSLRIPGPESPVFGVEMLMQVSYEDE